MGVEIPLGPAGDSAEQWVADWTASISARAAAAKELSERAAAITATAEGGDGAVRATVSGSGVLTDLRLDERVLGWTAQQIAAQVLATTRRAQGNLAAQITEIAAQTVGADSETGRTVVSSYTRRFPPAPDDDEDDTNDPRRRRPGYGRQ